MLGARNRNRAEGFMTEVATSDDDMDEAVFRELSSLDTFIASGSEARIQGTRNSSATGFERVAAENADNATPSSSLGAIDFVLEVIGDWI